MGRRRQPLMFKPKQTLAADIIRHRLTTPEWASPRLPRHTCILHPNTSLQGRRK